jgi:hypothetical protein
MFKLFSHENIEEHTYGSYIITPPGHVAGDSVNVSQQIVDAISTYNKNTTNDIRNIQWPYVHPNAVCEFTDKDLFPKAFPWLFPGGTGGFKQYRECHIDLNDWIHILMRYEDGRFASDRMWSFYVLNYKQRQTNQSKGSFFVNSFSSEKNKSLEEIVDELKQGNMSWIDKISYFGENAKGSPAFWRAKRNEVTSWIHHHINIGNGPPTFFITLSCAEYWWPDIERLITDRFQVASLAPPDFTPSQKISIINNYTVVVQEYFQA